MIKVFFWGVCFIKSPPPFSFEEVEGKDIFYIEWCKKWWEGDFIIFSGEGGGMVNKFISNFWLRLKPMIWIWRFNSSPLHLILLLILVINEVRILLPRVGGR